jgi:hypothetical protein
LLSRVCTHLSNESFADGLLSKREVVVDRRDVFAVCGFAAVLLAPVLDRDGDLAGVLARARNRTISTLGRRKEERE